MRATTHDAMSLDDFLEEQRVRITQQLFAPKPPPGIHEEAIEYNLFQRNDFYTRKQLLTELDQTHRGRV
jgi:hypothetical protein